MTKKHTKKMLNILIIREMQIKTKMRYRGRRVTTPTKPMAVPPASSVVTVGSGRKWGDLLPDPNSCEWSRGQRPRGLGPEGITLEAQVLPSISC